MTKTTRNIASVAEESFHRHYAAIWGERRWRESLYPALAEPTRYAALVNIYARPADFWTCLEEAQISRNDLEQLDFPRIDNAHDLSSERLSCYARASGCPDETNKPQENTPELPFPQPKASVTHPNRLMTHWNMDAASVLVASLLDIQPSEVVLDLCAAPGGKSIALSQRMWPYHHVDDPQVRGHTLSQDSARLVSNEADGRRQKRLAENLKAYLPPELFKQGYAQTTRIDATRPAPALSSLSPPGGYDKVLVDAPCSSERHIIHAHLKARASGNTAAEMTNWRPSSSKRLAKTQLELLLTALKATKMGGKVVYATCSIETVENDGVIEKMLSAVEKERKKGGKWSVKLGFGDGAGSERLEARLEEWAERTQYGWIVLPDHPGGGRWGPLFFTLVCKVPAVMT